MSPYGDPPPCTCWATLTTHSGAIGPCPTHGPTFVGMDLASGPDRTVTYLVKSAPTGCVTAPRIVMLGTADAPSDLLRYTAMIERRGDAIREALAAVPEPVIEEARPMNRKQRRDAARRGR